MASTINGTSTGNGGLISTGDDSGILNIQTNETTAISIDASQNATFAGKVTSAGALTLASNGTTTAVTIDTSQKVGIGNASPSAKLDVATSTAGFATILTNTNGASDSNGLQIKSGTGSTEYNLRLSNTSGSTDFMAVKGNGNVGIGTTSPDAQLHVVGQIRSSGSIAQAIYVYGAASVAPYITINQFGVRAWDIGAGTYSSGTFSIQSGGANGVYLGGTATSWASASDERIKDIIEPISNALTKVDGLRSVIGKYKTDEEGVRRSFLIAQDIQTQFPEALESSDSERLGVQYTDVIPLLVASIKELKAINDTQAETLTQQTEAINALTARIVALEK